MKLTLARNQNDNLLKGWNVIFTNDEIQQLRMWLDEHSNLDDELYRRCAHLLQVGAYDEAVRSAFVLLEERLRQSINGDGMTGTQLVNRAFNSKDGPLSKLLGRNQSEREGLRELYSGAFKLFRNPTAHSAVGYQASDGKEIIGLVNLMLRMLKGAEDLPAANTFPENIENALSKIETAIGATATSRLRVFLHKCIRIGIRPSPTSTQRIHFTKYAMSQLETWENPQPRKSSVFSLNIANERYTISFPTSYYYRYVVGFNVEQLIDELGNLGFSPEGKKQEPTINLRVVNSEKFFESLFELVERVAMELEDTL
ncbi:TIGR02391 family protein [Candidatus Parcubacteria bacterium]|nr:MAG: TIGR02391 family protein [Candidatus Parcubacteria bacterium]